MSDSNPKTIEPFEENEGHTIYQCGPVYFVAAEAGATLGDHTHEAAETLWFVSGEGTMHVGEEAHEISAPCEIYIASGVYHKLVTKTEMNFIEQRHPID